MTTSKAYDKMVQDKMTKKAETKEKDNFEKLDEMIVAWSGDKISKTKKKRGRPVGSKNKPKVK